MTGEWLGHQWTPFLRSQKWRWEFKGRRILEEWEWECERERDRDRESERERERETDIDRERERQAEKVREKVTEWYR